MYYIMYSIMYYIENNMYNMYYMHYLYYMHYMYYMYYSIMLHNQLSQSRAFGLRRSAVSAAEGLSKIMQAPFMCRRCWLT